MPRRKPIKKTIAKKTKVSPVGVKHARKEMRFNVSLVILIGMLTFSALLLLVSLNKSNNAVAKTSTSQIAPRVIGNIVPKTAIAKPADFSGLSGNFQLAIPASWKGWVYRSGEVKSPIDDSLSDQFVKVYLPQSVSDNEEANSPNLDSRYKDIFTVMNFSADEWKAMEKKCNRGDSTICDDMGKKLADAQCPGSAGGTDCVYSYTKQPNCSGALAARCNEVDKIMESFNLK